MLNIRRCLKLPAALGLALVSLLALAGSASARVEVRFNGTVATIVGDATDNRLIAVRDPASTVPGYEPAVWLHNDKAPNDIYAVGKSSARCGWQSSGYGYSCIGLTRVVIKGGDGNDEIVADSLPGTTNIKGGNGNDIVNGTATKDRVDGGNGNDQLNGGAGDDQITDITGGNDVIIGGAGSDKIKARFGADTVLGGVPFGDVPGRDTVKVGDRAGDDLVQAGRNGCLRVGADAGDRIFGAGQASDAFCLR